MIAVVLCSSCAERTALPGHDLCARCDTGALDDRPVHRPLAAEAPVPGVQHHAGCDPDRPRVGADGVCEGCGGRACPRCGFEVCECQKAAAA